MFSCFNGMIGLCNFHYDHTANFTPKKSRCYQPQSLQNPTWIHVNSTQKSLKTEVMQTCNYKKAAAFCNLLHPRKKLRWIPKKKRHILKPETSPFEKGPIHLGGHTASRPIVACWWAMRGRNWPLDSDLESSCFFFVWENHLEKGTECCRWIIDSGKLT